MDTTQTAQPTEISRERWNRTSSDYKTGSPRAGTAKMLMLEDDGATRLVPVVIV
jgi:hypothetical protein